MIASHLALKWAHIIAMVYWLGGEWGVFQTSYHVTNPNLSLEERRRHMGHNFGVQPLGGGWLVLMWILTAGWIGLALAAFARRSTDAGLRLTIWDERIRCVLIPVLAAAAIMSILTGKPFAANWYVAKVLIYSGLLAIGLVLRFVMRHWTTTCRQLAAGGPREDLEARLKREITSARRLACVYWIGIGTVAFIGVTKVF